MNEFHIQPFAKHHLKQTFDCGEPSLNDFLKKYARQNDARGLGKTFVAVLPNEVEVLAFYTISTASLSFEVLPEKLPRYPIPTAHLGRLAVDKRMQGRGLGEILLIDALEKTMLIADQIGIYAIELFALTENAKKFYLKYGFVELKDDDKHLYLPIKTIKDSFGAK